MHYTTLNKILEHEPCIRGLYKLVRHPDTPIGDDAPISMKHILDSNGLDDAIWALRAIDDERAVRLFTCDVAESVLHFFENEHGYSRHLRNSINVSRKYANEEATVEELAAARAATDYAAATAYATAAEKEYQEKLFMEYFCND